jgi:TolA-binding protein
MMRRVSVAILLAVLGTSTAAGKFKPEEQQYLDEQFRATQDQIQTLKTQISALTVQLNELRQNQTQLQAVIIRQQRVLQEMSQMLSAVRLSEEENFAGVKTALSRLETLQQKGFSTLTGQGGQALGVGAEPTAPARPATGTAAAPLPLQGYVVDVKGDDVTIDIGTEKGMNIGTRLAVYKANDPNTRVGVLEVVQPAVGSSRARVVTLNPGVQLEFSDIIRLE